MEFGGQDTAKEREDKQRKKMRGTKNWVFLIKNYKLFALLFNKM